MAKQQSEQKLAVSVEQAGQMLGISRGLAYQMAKTGELPTVRIGQRRLVVPLASLEAMLANSQEITADQVGKRRDSVMLGD